MAVVFLPLSEQSVRKHLRQRLMFRHAEHGTAGDGQLHLTRAMAEATAPGQTVPPPQT